MENLMNVLAINGSPNKEKGNTALILTPFLEGMKEAGAKVDLYYTEDLEINSCKGDYHCWFKTPGRCMYDDDMTWLLEKMNNMDIMVIGSPVYNWGITGPMKILLDRMIARVQPFVETRDGLMLHTMREGSKPHHQVVFVSNCGLWEMDHFDPILAQLQTRCNHSHTTFAGALLRPHGPALRAMMRMGIPVTDILEAARKSGQQLIKEGFITQELLDTISRPLLPKDKYQQIVNMQFTEMHRS